MLLSYDFRTYRGRMTVFGLFALAWALEAVRTYLYSGIGLMATNAVFQGLGFLIFSPIFGILPAWLLWKLAFKKAKGLFPFSLATVTACWTAWALLAASDFGLVK